MLNRLKFKHQMAAFPKHCWWEISAGEMERAKLQSRAYSNDIARRNAYISDLCLKTVVNWLETEPDLQAESLTILPSKADLPSIWEFLPGVALQLGPIKLVLIPSETLETDQFSVPFEWVDISPWAADYYLAVQMNLEEDQHWMRIWGFTTHKRLKLGTIDPVKRLYKMDAQDLTQDLNVLWTMRSIAPAIIPPSPLAKLSLDALNLLLDQLSQPTIYSPRLELAFDQWSAVIANDRWRRILCDRRQRSVLPSPVPALVNLRQWLQRMAVEDPWQTTDAFLVQAVPVRGPAQLESTLEAIAPILRLVRTTTSEQIRQQAAGVLGEIGANHPETVDLLVELLQSEQAETRWQAAISLGKVAPDHPLSGIRRAKLIDLGLQLDHDSIALIVAIMPTVGDRIAVFLQVQSVDQRLDLPPQLKISVLSASGETRLQAEVKSDTESRDKSIDLRFSPPSGSRFQVKVELNDICVTEEFLT